MNEPSVYVFAFVMSFCTGLATMFYTKWRTNEHMSEFDSKLYDYRRAKR